MALSPSPKKEPFCDMVFISAAILDPNTGLTWINLDVKVLSDYKDGDIEDAELSAECSVIHSRSSLKVSNESESCPLIDVV